jgi:hypothetical protein
MDARPGLQILFSGLRAESLQLRLVQRGGHPAANRIVLPVENH